MLYLFEGKNFFYTKYCNDLNQVTATIERSTHPFVVHNYFINKKIRKVTDEIGTVIYQSK